MKSYLLLLSLLLIGATTNAQVKTWTADNGNGTYTNPLFYDEFSDPDCIRVGEDYYLAGTTMHCAPGLVAYRLTDDEVTHIPSYNEQGIEQAEECLQLAVAIEEDGIGGNHRGRQQHGKQGPCVEMVLAQRISEPQVIHPGHLKTCSLEGTDLHTKTNDGHHDGRQEE